MRSDYRVITFNGPRRIIFIEDLNLGRMSVTNDAYAVLQDVWSNFQGHPRVVYKDSEGVWSEIILKEAWTQNVTFKPWHGVAWDILQDKELS
jgi:hypothetical protein